MGDQFAMGFRAVPAADGLTAWVGGGYGWPEQNMQQYMNAMPQLMGYGGGYRHEQRLRHRACGVVAAA